MSRQVSLPVAGLSLVAVLFTSLAVARMIRRSGPAAAASPHAEVAGFEPSAANVSADLTNRLHALRSTVAADPSDTSSLLELARLLHDAHQPGEAVTFYRRYLDANPGNLEAWFDLADSEGRAGNWTAARTTMQSLLERTPGDPLIQYNLGVIELQIGDGGAARDWFGKVAAQTADTALAARARSALADLEKGS